MHVASHDDVAAFGVGLGVSVVDPVNIATGFVPIVRAAQAARLATRFGKPVGRAITGGIEGAVGTAALEPLILYAARQDQSEYGPHLTQTQKLEAE